MRASIFLSVIVAAAAIGSAQAGTVGWDTSSGGGSSFTSSTGSSAGNQMTFTATTGEILKARAFYVTPNANNTANTAAPLTAATLEIYSAGLGVTSPSAGECSGCSPEHTVDNSGLKEMVVFQLPSANWDPSMVHLTPFGSSTVPLDTDVTFLVGGAPEFTGFSSFSGKSLDYLLAHGFTSVDDVTASTSERDVAVNTTPQTGQWLIVAAWLNDDTPEDHFKIGTVAAKSGGGTSVPEPATLSLLTFGICAVGAYRRRRLSSEA
jgi:hypothetical protein